MIVDCLQDEQQANCRIIEGHFLSPFAEIIPGIMPEEVEVARFVSDPFFFIVAHFIAIVRSCLAELDPLDPSVKTSENPE